MGIPARITCASAALVLVACTASAPEGFPIHAKGAPAPAASGAQAAAPPSTGDDGSRGDTPSHPPPTSQGADDAGMTTVPAMDAGGATTTPDAAPNDGFDAFQHHNLDVINTYRAGSNLPPLALDPKMSAFAIAGSQELSQDHSPHQHFIDASNAGTIFTDGGFTNSASENQGDPSGWPMASQDPTANEMSQIDGVLQAMIDEGPGGGHYQSIMDPNGSRIGVGLIEVGGLLYLTNDFSE